MVQDDETLVRPGDDRRAELKEYMLFAPRFLKLIGRLLRDPRIPARQKAIFLFSGVYLISPVDLIPDFIPGFGQADDLLLLIFALDQIVNRVPEEAVRDNWDGDEDVLQIGREILDIATAFVPAWVKRRLSTR